MSKRISTPLIEADIKTLRAGDEVLLDGVIYTARDLAHQRLAEAIKAGAKLPFSLSGQVIYYCGPAPAPQGRVIGSCGPTTSARMDDFTPALLKAGLKGMIGKGWRSPEVEKAIRRHKAVYFITIGGAGALLSTRVRQAGVVAYREFGPEAIYRLEVKDFPLIVAVDSQGRSIDASRRKR